MVLHGARQLAGNFLVVPGQWRLLHEVVRVNLQPAAFMLSQPSNLGKNIDHKKYYIYNLFAYLSYILIFFNKKWRSYNLHKNSYLSAGSLGPWARFAAVVFCRFKMNLIN